MITALIVPNSGLGNLLFQYAAARRLAIRNQTGVILDFSWCFNRFEVFRPKASNHLGNFQISADVKIPNIFYRSTRFVLKKMNVQPTGPGLYLEPETGYSPGAQDLPDGTVLFGFFQSEKYFQDIADTIRTDLKIIHMPATSNVYTQIQDQIGNTNSVAVHVRRTDHLDNPRLNICTPAYYANASLRMQQMVGNPRYFVFSDDLPWAQANIPLENATYVKLPDSQSDPIYDLSLMAACKHQIIANSTYSWWGAWLNENPQKVVISPDAWKKSALDNEHAMRDILPDQWIKIPIEY